MMSGGIIGQNKAFSIAVRAIFTSPDPAVDDDGCLDVTEYPNMYISAMLLVLLLAFSFLPSGPALNLIHATIHYHHSSLSLSL